MGLMTRHRSGTTNFMNRPIVFIDIETTRSGEICEIGAVKVDPLTVKVIDELDLKLGIENPSGLTEFELSFDGYNGFNFLEWHDAVQPEQALDCLNDFCSGCVQWGYNVSFEFYWLERYFTKFGRDWQGDYHWFDLMTKAYVSLEPDFINHRLTTLSLSSIGKYLGLDEEAHPHRGLAGARYEREIYFLLTLEQEFRKT